MNVLCVDTGLASFGACVFTVRPGPAYFCRHVDVFESHPLTSTWDITMAVDVTRRARELASWLEQIIVTWTPELVVSEAMPVFSGQAGGIKNTFAQALNGAAWGVLCSELQRRLVPLKQIAATSARRAVCGVSNETKAQAVAMRMFPSFAEFDDKLGAKKVHARDALVVMAAACNLGWVRAT